MVEQRKQKTKTGDLEDRTTEMTQYGEQKRIQAE